MQPAWKFEGRLRELGRELIADIAGTPAASPLSVQSRTIDQHDKRARSIGTRRSTNSSDRAGYSVTCQLCESDCSARPELCQCEFTMAFHHQVRTRRPTASNFSA